MNILVVEDNRQMAELIKKTLEEDGEFNVLTHDPRTEPQPRERIDFLLLDEDLDGLSGLEYLRTFRQKNAPWSGPVIVVTGYDSEEVIKKAFQSGVDDYVIKPFKSGVLKGKVRALAQRAGLLTGGLSAGPIEISERQHRALIAGQDLSLTLTEYRILRELVRKRDQLVSREELREFVFDGAHVSDRTIDVHICSLRKKIKAAGDPLKTIRGVGYRLAL